MMRSGSASAADENAGTATAAPSSASLSGPSRAPRGLPILRPRSPETMPADERRSGGRSDGEGGGCVDDEALGASGGAGVGVGTTSIGVGTFGDQISASSVAAATVSEDEREGDDSFGVGGGGGGGLLGAVSTPRKAEAAQDRASSRAVEAQLLPLDGDRDDHSRSFVSATTAPRAVPQVSAVQSSDAASVSPSRPGPSSPPDEQPPPLYLAGRATVRSSVFRTKLSSGGSAGGSGKGSSSGGFFGRGRAAQKKCDNGGHQRDADDNSDGGESSSDSDRSFHSPLQDMDLVSSEGAPPAVAAEDADLVNMLMISSPNHKGRRRASARANARAAARRSRARRAEDGKGDSPLAAAATVSDGEEGRAAGVMDAAVRAACEAKSGDEERKASNSVDFEDFDDGSNSDEEASAEARRAMTYSKYDYDMNWDMIGSRRRILQDGDGYDEDRGEDSGQAGREGSNDASTTTGDMETAADTDEASAATEPTASTSTGAGSGFGVGDRVSGSAASVSTATLPPPSFPLQFPPRRRTRSSPGRTMNTALPSSCSVAASTYAPAVPPRTRRQYYAYQRRDLLDDESDIDGVNVADCDDGEFDDIRNWDDDGADDGCADDGADDNSQIPPPSGAGFFNEYDDFAGSPVFRRRSASVHAADAASSEVGEGSVHTAEGGGGGGGASVSTGSSSSSSSIRRRAFVAASSLGGGGGGVIATAGVGGRLPAAGSAAATTTATFGPGSVSGFGRSATPSVSSVTVSTASVPTGPPSRPSSRRRLNPRSASLPILRRGAGTGAAAAAAAAASAAGEGSGDSSSGGVAAAASSSSSLRSSLDAGMSALRRWARSRTVGASVPTVTPGPRPSRAVSTQLQLGEEDIHALSNAGSRDHHHPRDAELGLGVSVRRGGVGAAGRTSNHDFDEEFRHEVFGMGHMYPPPIAEEEDEGGLASGGRPSGTGSPGGRGFFRGLRQRAFSEPDRTGTMRELISAMLGSRGQRSDDEERAVRSHQQGGGASRSQPTSPWNRRQRSGGGGSGLSSGVSSGDDVDRTPRRRGQRRRQRRQGSSDNDEAADLSAGGGGVTRPASQASSGSGRSLGGPVAPPYLSSTALSASSLFHTPEHAPPAAGRDPLDLLESGRSGGGVGAAPLAQLREVGRSSDDELVSSARDDTGDEGGGTGGENNGGGGGGGGGGFATRADEDPNREARGRWIRINRRFQLIITIVALIFSMLLFAILVCWVVLTSAYVVSIDKMCDVPLKTYFWLATLQLILDVFRTDILRFVFRWDANSRQRIPTRVILYNIAYLVYAMMVLRMGVMSVFTTKGTTCPRTAPELFQTSLIFVILSLSAWGTIVLGYLGPFCFVAVVLTRNGYSPSADIDGQNSAAGGPIPGVGGVFPVTYSNNAAPPGTVDRLRVVLLDEFPEEYPKDCCICMGDFTTGEIIVATECDHVFHKRCCHEWLRQARTCPVCRMDIPNSLRGRGGGSVDDAMLDEESYGTRDHIEPPNRPPFNREEFHQEVVNLLRMLRRQEERLRERLNTPQSDGNDVELREVSTTGGGGGTGGGLSSSLGRSNMVVDEDDSDAASTMRSLEDGRSTTTRRSRGSTAL